MIPLPSKGEQGAPAESELGSSPVYPVLQQHSQGVLTTHPWKQPFPASCCHGVGAELGMDGGAHRMGLRLAGL